MSHRSQSAAIQAVLSETDLLKEFTENVGAINSLGPGMVPEIETKIGTFQANYGKSYEITLFIGAKIAKKEVENGK